MVVSKQLAEIETIFEFIGSVQREQLSPPEQRQLLTALLTPSELEAISQRIVLLKKLLAKRPHREISQEMSMGIATVTRGNRILNENKDLFERVLIEEGN
jgi:TrpR family trp operon transcriptional repressor